MFVKVTSFFQFVDDAKFIRFTKKYYTLQYVDFKFIFEYLNHIKQLKKRIRVTKIILDDDKQTIFYLITFLLKIFQYLTKI